jgi:hypothetical protein
MNKLALLAELRALAETAPSFDLWDPSSPIQQSWLGRVHALLARWNMEEANTFRTATDVMGVELLRANSLTKVFGILNRAIADLELQVPTIGSGTTGPGAIFDFTKVLRELLASAMESILIVDPVLDEQVFTGYLSSIQPQVVIRLLVREKADSLKPAMDAIVTQKKLPLELRESDGVHDRIVCIDGRSCWVSGQPMKISVRTKQSYLAPLAAEVAELKLNYYQGVWGSARPVGGA